MLKQDRGPLDPNDVFLSSSTESIKWSELHDNLDAKIEILKQHNIGPHVVFVVAEDIVTLDDYLWILASVKNGGSATQADGRQSQLERDALARSCKAACVIRSNEITMLNDPLETGPTILHENECYRGMTSGTTSKEFFEMYPFFWTSEEHHQSEKDGKTLLGCTSGAANNHMFAVMPEFKTTDRPRFLNTRGFTATYNAFNLLRAYQTGGSIHFLNHGDDYWHELATSGVNVIATYPNAAKKIIESVPENVKMDVPYFELSGGYTPPDIIEDITRKFRFTCINNMMASTEADCHTRAEYRPGDPIENFYDLRFRDYQGELELREGVLWYRYGNIDWQTDGDKFEVNESGGWSYKGRVFDDVIFMKSGVKVYTGLVEALAQEVDGIEYVSSCSKDELHYVIYVGNANIFEVEKKLKEAQRSKRPHHLWRVSYRAYFGSENKLQKSKLVDTVKDNVLEAIRMKPDEEV